MDKKERIYLCLIILLAFLVRFLNLLEIHNNPLPYVIVNWEAFDQYRFMELARVFLNENWIGIEVTRYSPVYSWVIALLLKLFGDNLTIVFLFQMLLGVLACYVIYKIAFLIFENKTIGLISSFIMALYAPLIFYETKLIRAALITYSVLFSFYFFLIFLKSKKLNYVFFSGLILGFSIVLRPHVLPLFIIIYLLFTKILGRKKTIQSIGVFLVALIIMILPLFIRNMTLGKKVIISYQGPSTFWIGNTFDSTGVGLPRRDTRNVLANESQGSIAKTFLVFAKETSKHPSEYIKLYLNKMRMFFNAYEVPGNLNYYLFVQQQIALKIAIFNFGFIIPLALLTLILVKNKYIYIPALCLFLSVLVFSVVLFHIQGRYRLPSVPFFIILASYGIWTIFNSLKNKKYGFVLGVALLLFVFLSLTKINIDEVKYYSGSLIRESDYIKQVAAYLSKGNCNDLTNYDIKKLNYNLDMMIGSGQPDLHLDSYLHIIVAYNFMGCNKKAYEVMDYVDYINLNNPTNKKKLAAFKDRIHTK